MSDKPKFFKKKTLVTITYCEGNFVTFPGKVTTVEIPGRGGCNLLDAQHFAKSHCFKNGWLLCHSSHKVVDREPEE